MIDWRTCISSVSVHSLMMLSGPDPTEPTTSGSVRFSDRQSSGNRSGPDRAKPKLLAGPAGHHQPKLECLTKHGVHGVSCAAHIIKFFAQVQHVLRTVVRTFTMPPPIALPPHPTPSHPRFSQVPMGSSSIRKQFTSTMKDLLRTLSSLRLISRSLDG